MANPNSIPLNLDRELGEAIRTLIGQTSHGESTTFVKEYMEKHKDELIDLWNKQGKDGQAIFDKWFKKWSMTKAEQEQAKAQKEQDAFELRKKAYLALSVPEERAIELAKVFPDKDPCDVVKISSYATQSNLGKTKFDAETKDAIADIDNQIATHEKRLNDNPNASGSFKRQETEIIEQLRKQKETLQSET